MSSSSTALLLEKMGCAGDAQRRSPAVPASRQAPARQASPRPRPATMVETVMALASGRLVVPAYGFDDVAHAERYLAAVGQTIDGGDRRRTVIRAGSRVYVERDIGMTEYSMDLVPFCGQQRDPRHRQPWPILRRSDSPKPDGAYHALLLPEGRRETHWYGNRKRAAPWVKHAQSGPWDVAVAWERGDGNGLGAVYENDGLRVYAARSARGVMIARRAVIGPAGQVERYVTETWLMTLDVLDRKAGDDDLVRPHFEVQSFVDEDPVDVTTYRERVAAAAQPCFDRAATIFRHRCGAALPRGMDAHLLFFQEQNAAARSRAGDAFRESIRDLDFRAALDRCQEPWQLEIAIGEFGYSSEFADNPMHFSRGQTTGKMLQLYKKDRPEARGKLIDRWWRDYVSQTTDMWNYTGD